MNDRGVVLIEVIVALLISLAVLGALFGLVAPAQRLFQRQPEAADLQQRMRDGFRRLHTDLLMAGAGPDELALGWLGELRPAVLPYVLGATRRQIDRGFPYRPDALSLLFVPGQVRPRAIIASPLHGSSAHVVLEPGARCPGRDALCGFPSEGLVLVFDEAGRSDLFRVAEPRENILRLLRLAAASARSYAPGSHIVPVELHSYYFDSHRSELRHHDGWNADFPVIEDVVGFSVRLFGRRGPPGPLLMQAASDCLSGRDGQPRLVPLGSGAALIELGEGVLSDGPWCEHAGDPYDADLHRVRRIAISLRLQVSSWHLRGVAEQWFQKVGENRDVGRTVRDYEINFEVAPRNLDGAPAPDQDGRSHAR